MIFWGRGIVEVMLSPVAVELGRIFEAPTHRVDLGRAALVLARFEYPALDVDSYLKKFDQFAKDAPAPPESGYEPERVIDDLNRYFFEGLGFAGNKDDYYNQRNSFLNDVIDRRTGIPISLAVVYLEVARRLGLPFYGVGLPGHFVVKYDDGRREIYIDVFRRGALLDRDGCQALVTTLRGQDTPLSESDFRGVDSRHILIRMLNNLRNIYLDSRQYRKGLPVLDAIVALAPAVADTLKHRAWLHHEMGQWAEARRDLETYLSLRPDADDASDARRWISRLRKKQAAMN